MSSVDESPEGTHLPEELPPVQPPSAGFILQLFVVPGLIVMAIVAVWLLFGKLAGNEQDWKGQLVELQHPNEHRRWRAALSLAQILKADQGAAGTGEHLSRNREIAQTLAEVLAKELKSASQSDEELKYQAFLARTLGLFDLPDVVLPALVQAMQPGVDREVRKNAIGSIAVMADRMATSGDPLTQPGLTEALLRISQDNDPMIRQLSAFTLGLFADVATKERLEVMLDDANFDTRVNAAIALARRNSAQGVRVFVEVLESATKARNAGSDDEYEQFVALKNCLKAVEEVREGFTPAERKELVALVEPIAAGFREPGIRIAAKNALSALHAAR
jgi:HEAT repeat protein